ncbi:histone-lysine N-methyltransferase SMYD3 isoform X1 [Parasteatoda tepidariorum]|uniref:histone-lysine N-methyltransferase SMYD3 isoform X1 n=2 Tax=Parasteatoda tepidariorum TaxID=114398 RepID=UPI00077FCF75|nr:histone-lysine N-methyltransferase SMYD3 isoform X1 [Parasteatoda tepidariorum]
MTEFELGELILSSTPFAHVLSNEFRGQYCDYCFIKKDNLKRCSQCSFLYFCDKNCQVKAWEMHKTECKFIKKAGDKKPTPSLRLIALIIFKIKKYGTNEPSEDVYGRKVSFASLMSHAEEIKQDLKRCQIIMAMLITLKEYIGSDNLPPPAEFTEIFGKMCVNSFSICHEMSPIGSGLYLGASVFDHSCDPEAVAVFDGTTLNVRMMKKVPHRDIQKVFISYVGELLLKEEKQRQLKEQYYFSCKCSYCIFSQNDDLMTKLFDDSVEVKEKALKCEGDLESIKQMLNDQKDPELINDACSRLLEEENEVLGDTNIYKIRTLEIAFDTCIKLQAWDKAITLASCLEEPLRLYFGTHHPSLGIFLFKYGKILHFKEFSNVAVTKLSEAENVFKITHGEHHPLTKELESILHDAKLSSVFIDSKKELKCIKL